ncbi:MAG: chorismate synthase [Thermoplasmata archaeon]|nr:chorismate synthase [Thermoplasmata archaeon]
MNSFGRLFRVSLFGESHGEGVGVLVDGVPPGLPISVAALQRDLDARKPGGRLVSQRREPDVPRILSGVLRGKATGAPVCVWVENKDVQSKPYADLGRTPRPGHADFVNQVWGGGHADLRGGGHASGRLTAGLVVAGTMAQGILGPVGIRCAAHLHQVGPRRGPDGAVAVGKMSAGAGASPVKTAHKGLEKAFAKEVENARRAKDSVGGVVEFRAEGLPVGLGDPYLDPLESTLAHLLFAVPAVKGVSFGAGFAAAAMHGSEHNDAFAIRKGTVVPRTNHAGGILGGRTTGAPVWGHVAVKPASSIAQEQDTVDLVTGKSAKITMTGRHDPCIAIRAVPVVKACLAIALADAVLVARSIGLEGASAGRKVKSP